MTLRLGPGAETTLVGVLLAAEGLLFSRNLDAAASYDEGVYLASLDALRRGETLGSDVFASQPPGFYVLLRLVGLFGGSSLTDLRLGFLAVALCGCLAAYVCGRFLFGIGAGVAASALVAITPPLAGEAPRVAADVPSVALSVVALAFAAAAVRRRSTALALLAGGAAAAAVSVKLLAVTVVVPLVGLAPRSSRRQAAGAVVGAIVVGAAFAVAYAGELGSIWHDAFSFHRSARGYGGGEASAHELAHFLQFGTPSAWLIVLGALASIAVPRVWPFWLWPIASALFLLWQKPLFEHHLVLLAVSLGLSAGLGLGGGVTRLGGRRAAVAAAVVIAALAVGLGQQMHRLDYAHVAEPEELRWGAERLAACTRPGELVASDQPIVAFRAHRRLPGELVDTSLVRLQTGSLPPSRVLEILRRDTIRAVFVGRAFADEPALLAEIHRLYPRRLAHDDVAIYARGAACP